jgi:hypothetical protein
MSPRSLQFFVALGTATLCLASCGGSKFPTEASAAQCFRQHGWHVEEQGKDLVVDGPQATFDFRFHPGRLPTGGWTGYAPLHGPGPKVIGICLR